MGIFNALKKKSAQADSEYIVFDLETTGLSREKCEILEISAIKVKDKQIVDSFSELSKPVGPLDPVAQRINKITEDDLKHADSIDKVLVRFLDFIGPQKLVGYNITSFDLPILKRHLDKYGLSFENDHEDVYPLAVSRIDNLSNYKLSTVASYFCILPEAQLHRGMPDCIMTKGCYESLIALPKIEHTQKTRQKQFHTIHTQETIALQQLEAMIKGIVVDGIITDKELEALAVWLDENKDLRDQYPFNEISILLYRVLEDGVVDESERLELFALFNKILDPIGGETDNYSSLADKNIVLTGDFDHGTRSEIEKYIKSIGGKIKSAVSGKTDFLIVGNQGSPDWSFGNYGSKIKRAKELQAAGKPILIITEDDLFSASEGQN